MGILDTLQEDDAQQLLYELRQGVVALTRRVELLDVFLGPKREDLMFRKPYQVATVPAGQTLDVFREEIRDWPGYVGVVTHIGNDWFPNTSLTRYIDGRAQENPIVRQIAPVNNPLVVKIFVERDIVWTATNSDTVAHTFGILTNGYLIPKDLYDQAVGVEG